MTDTRQLLEEYAKNGSETAFRELVGRYIDLVYSAAIRLVDGDTHLAQDVVQTVFVDLARKAGTLSREVLLGGWLHQHTCYTARTLLRGERRRQHRERQAVEMNTQQDHTAANLAKVAPVLDEAINQLGSEDRAAILLRFFERSDFRVIGRALGSNEDAAQKRVSRALDKLHALLKNRGVTFSAAALGSALAAEAVAAAPVGMAASISTAALSGAAGGGTALTLMKIMSMTKIKLALAGTVMCAAVATPMVVEHKAETRLRDENQTLRVRADRTTELEAENQRLAALVGQQTSNAALLQEQMSELLKLRSEVGALRKQGEELARARDEIRQLKVQAPRTLPVNTFQERIVSTVPSTQSAEEAMRNACINNLRQIDGTKQQWALEHVKVNATADTIPAQEDIQPYLGRGTAGTFPICPSGGAYTILSLKQMPTCSVPGHALQ